MRIEAFGRTEQGPVRASHQDAIVLGGLAALAPGATLALSRVIPPGKETAETTLIVAVIDGMGGYAGGEDAAAVAAGAFAQLRAAPEAGWTAWFEALSDKVAAAGRAWGSEDMGATAAALLVGPARVIALNVGDCRIYRVRDGYVGMVSVEDRGVAGGRTVVTQSLGGPQRALDPHELALDIGEAGDRYVLCSDGLFGALGDARLAELLGVGGMDVAALVSTVVTEALGDRCDDNVSMIALDLFP